MLAGIALGLALQGRVAETGALFDEAKTANPAYRESILVELEATVRWLAGDFAAAVTLVHEAVAWQPTATPRRRAIGLTMGALAAIERDDVVEAERLVTRAKEAYGGRDWSYFLQLTHAAEAVLAWHAGRAADCVAALRPAAARLVEMQARPWAAFALFDLAEAAAEAGDAAAATAAAADLHAVAEFVELPLYRGLAAAASAWAGLAVGDGEQAVVSARQSIELLASTDCAAYLGRAHHVLGRALPATRARRPWPRSSERRRSSASAGAAGAGSARSTPCDASAAPAAGPPPRRSGPAPSPAASTRWRGSPRPA